ncbi:MAG: HIT family protein [Sedimentisphaerales bacterium]|nr:HIT family protein [Sedimentisphaerales bacterium]
MTGSECIFCKIIAGNIPCYKIYEDDMTLAFLDVGPISTGHTLIVPKEHYKKLHECPAKVLAAVSEIIGMIAGVIVETMESDGYNVLCNNGRSAGQIVDHVHFHVIPRNFDDGVFNRWPKFEYQPGQAEKVAAKIREKL